MTVPCKGRAWIRSVGRFIKGDWFLSGWSTAVSVSMRMSL